MLRANCLLVLGGLTLMAQPPQQPGPGGELIRKGSMLDSEGKGAEARVVFQSAIDSAPTPAAKASAERAMAMSWAFEGDCKKTAEYETRVMGYWKTQEKEAPGNAFYQQGEMADEAARVCIDNGDLDTAHELYKKGMEIGLSEPGISPGRKLLWQFRWEHAQARLAARRGHAEEAAKHVAAAKEVLEELKQKDDGLFRQQSSFIPYLTGYVALYGGDYKKALTDFQNANQNDAFIQCLIGMTYEKLGEKDKAMEAYRQAMTARGHNPPAAFAHSFAKKKLR